MILSPKWQQTYEEALQAMKDTTYSQYSLADVSTHHHTEELLEAALRNNRCSLRDIPVEKRTLRLCHVALECCHSINVQYIPKEYFDYNFSLKAASYCPATLSTILYFFRNGGGRNPTQQKIYVSLQRQPVRLVLDKSVSTNSAIKNKS